MAEYTPNSGLYKPNRSDDVEVDVSLAENFTKIDTQLAHTATDLDQRSVNVRSFGAKGDGVTDDLNSIQQAVNTGKPVFFPPGEYYLSGRLDLQTVQKTTLYGKPRTVTLKGNLNFTTDALIRGNNNVSIDGIDIDGAGQIGIIFHNRGNNVTLSNMIIRNTKHMGIFFRALDGATRRNIKITDCEIHNTGHHGISFYGHAVPYGVYENVEIHNIILRDIGHEDNGHDWTVGIQIEYLLNEKLSTFNLSNIHAENCFENGIYLSQNNASINISACVCIGNGTKSNATFASGFRIAATKFVKLRDCLAVNNNSVGFNIRPQENYTRSIDMVDCISEGNRTGYYMNPSSSLQNFSMNMRNCKSYNNRDYGLHLMYTSSTPNENIFFNIVDYMSINDCTEQLTSTSRQAAMRFQRFSSTGSMKHIFLRNNHVLLNKDYAFAIRADENMFTFMSGNTRDGNNRGITVDTINP